MKYITREWLQTCIDMESREPYEMTKGITVGLLQSIRHDIMDMLNSVAFQVSGYVSIKGISSFALSNDEINIPDGATGQIEIMEHQWIKYVLFENDDDYVLFKLMNTHLVFD